jgi:hypothetical protein
MARARTPESDDNDDYDAQEHQVYISISSLFIALTYLGLLHIHSCRRRYSTTDEAAADLRR